MNAPTAKPIPFGLGIVNACPHCHAALILAELPDALALSVCEACGEAFTHEPHPDGRICARMPREWFLKNTIAEMRAELRRVQESVWMNLGQWG